METNIKKIRVLMIGPGEGIIGGISTLVDTFLPVLEKQVSLFYLSSVKKRPLKDSGKLSFRNLIIAFSQYARFMAAIFRFRPHIVHLHTSQGIAWLKDTLYVVIAKVFRAYIILHMHGGNFDMIYEKNPPIIQWYTRKMLNIADAVIVVSSEWKTRLETLTPKARVLTIINCIDTQKILPAGTCNAGRAVHILFLGRIGPLKGAFDLIEAIHCLQQGKINFHVWMVGPEERVGDIQNARQLLEKYQLVDNCELLGSVHRERVLQFFQEANIFVLPSQYEGLPLAILEALAAGLPVVATCVGGIPEVVRENENGFLIIPGDQEALTVSLTKLITDADLRKRMGLRSREFAERELNVQSFVEKITSLYSSLVC